MFTTDAFLLNVRSIRSGDANLTPGAILSISSFSKFMRMSFASMMMA